MRVLVTGTSGFIGSHLADLLSRAGSDVLGLDMRAPLYRPAGVTYVQCDILDREQLIDEVTRFAPDALLHLAARTDLDDHAELVDYAANIEGVANVIDAIRATPSIRRTICTSSQLVFTLGEQPLNDTDYKASTTYGQSKIRTEEIWREARGGGTTWCIVRPTTIWGPRMNPHYLKFFRMLRSGRYFHVGTGPTQKSYGYVGNSVFQYKRLLEARADEVRGKTFYLADYEPLSIEDWAERLRIALKGPPIRTVPKSVATALARVGDLLNKIGWTEFPFNSFRLRNVLTPYVLDLGATRSVCGDLPFSMEQGVAATAEWALSALD
jgi:nucleoside-diphosphate-sugar epimerase